MQQIEVTIVVVNYNGGELIHACIESVIRETLIHTYEIIVVDNDSTDGSVKAISEKFPSIKVIENGANLGFAAANNVGFEVAQGEYILLLNPDTRIINGAIDKSIAYLHDHDEVGALGCKVLLETGEQQSTLIRFPKLSDIVINAFIPNQLMRKSSWLGRSRYVGLDYDLEHDVDVVAGCFMMLHNSVIDNVGRMDDDFFMFGEEVEWCWRISQSRKKIRYYPGCTIVHHGGGCSSSLSYRKGLLIAKGQLMVFRKTRGTFVATVANLLMLLRDAPRAMIWVFLRLFGRESANKRVSLKSSYIRFSYLLLYLVGIEQEI